MCLINGVYPLAPVPLVCVVKAVVTDTLFCCFGMLGRETSVAKTVRCRLSGNKCLSLFCVIVLNSFGNLKGSRLLNIVVLKLPYPDIKSCLVRCWCLLSAQ